MSFFEIFLLSLALAADAFSVALVISTQGYCRTSHIVRLSLLFAFFQAFMPVLGFFLVNSMYGYVAKYDHWIGFILLSIVGAKMLWESYTYKATTDGATTDGATTDDATRGTDPTKGVTALTLAVATSLDALAVGGTFATMRMHVWVPAVTIGLVCLVMTAFAMILGRYLVQKNIHVVRYANVLGGIVLMGIGVKILLSHSV